MLSASCAHWKRMKYGKKKEKKGKKRKRKNSK